LEEQGASKGPDPVALRHAGYTAAHKIYRDETGAPKVIGANWEMTVK